MARKQTQNPPVVMKNVTISIPADVHRALKIEAAERSISMGDLVVEALGQRITFLPRALRKADQP